MYLVGQRVGRRRRQEHRSCLSHLTSESELDLDLLKGGEAFRPPFEADSEAAAVFEVEPQSQPPFRRQMMSSMCWATKLMATEIFNSQFK